VDRLARLRGSSSSDIVWAVRERTRSRACSAVAILVAVLLLATGAHAQEEPVVQSPHPLAMAADLVFMRPLGLVVAVVGPILFVPVALVSAPEGRDGIREAWEMFVVVPAGQVFERPLGDF
jgi:hypothetical protein